MNVLVTHPYVGSVWLMNARYDGEWVVGEASDDSGVGSALMPDDFRGESVTLNFPRSCIRKVEPD
jgi:hypothetical protein